ncbi:hypothetical protein CAPTEDRAFT_113640, partial [Capitella teleta]
QAIKLCNKVYFPNIFVLLKIACSIPVTSCECERSASRYLRASMGSERLSFLALLHVHYDMHVDLDKVVDIFAHKHPRRLELKFIVTPEPEDT